MVANTYITMTEQELNDFARKVAEETAMRLTVMPRYLTIEEASSLCKCSTRTMQNWIEKGVVEAKRIGGQTLIIAESITENN